MKPIRIALSGSGFKFPAHVGALLAVRDAGYTPIEYAGTSGGSIVATLAASGMSVEDMKLLTLSRDWSSMLSFSPWALLTQLGYCSGSTLLDWLCTQTSRKTFAQLPVGLTVMASDIAQESGFVFSKTHTPDTAVALAARASSAIPFVFAPVKLPDVLLMDGGMVNNIPVDVLIKDDVPRLGVQLVSKTSPLGVGRYGLLDLAPRVLELMLSANENIHIDLDEHDGAHFAFVETGYANGLDRNMNMATRERLLNDGYAAARDALAQLFQLAKKD